MTENREREREKEKEKEREREREINQQIHTSHFTPPIHTKKRSESLPLLLI